jgi:hypothetical protein
MNDMNDMERDEKAIQRWASEQDRKQRRTDKRKGNKNPPQR